jgi:hypothetical protein
MKEQKRSDTTFQYLLIFCVTDCRRLVVRAAAAAASLPPAASPAAAAATTKRPGPKTVALDRPRKAAPTPTSRTLLQVCMQISGLNITPYNIIIKVYILRSRLCVGPVVSFESFFSRCIVVVYVHDHTLLHLFATVKK